MVRNQPTPASDEQRRRSARTAAAAARRAPTAIGTATISTRATRLQPRVLRRRPGDGHRGGDGAQPERARSPPPRRCRAVWSGRHHAAGSLRAVSRAADCSRDPIRLSATADKRAASRPVLAPEPPQHAAARSPACARAARSRRAAPPTAGRSAPRSRSARRASPGARRAAGARPRCRRCPACARRAARARGRAGRPRERLLPVRRLADRLEARGGVDHLAGDAAEHRLVVDREDADRVTSLASVHGQGDATLGSAPRGAAMARAPRSRGVCASPRPRRRRTRRGTRSAALTRGLTSSAACECDRLSLRKIALMCFSTARLVSTSARRSPRCSCPRRSRRAPRARAG